jgi:hypothetical protein
VCAGSSSTTTAATTKPSKRRSPKDEAIKIFGELLRDKEWVRKVEAKVRIPPVKETYHTSKRGLSY